jgi:hypothetical protein
MQNMILVRSALQLYFFFFKFYYIYRPNPKTISTSYRRTIGLVFLHHNFGWKIMHF